MRWAALALTLALPAAAETTPETNGALRWMADQSSLPLTFRTVGTLDIAPGGVVSVDPLTWSPGMDWPFVETPSGPARFVVALDETGDSVSKALLIFSDAAVACGTDEATVGVDTGLVAFLDRPRSDALLADGQALMDRNKDLYNDWLHDLIGEKYLVTDLLPLPSGPRIPVSSSGYGDGGYPVASLSDAEGQMVALYMDFLGKNDDGAWLLPAPCQGPKVTRADPPGFPPSNL